ncbi:MAG: lytic transglycosylase domain-containing protein [Rhizobiaceae bacterium]
MRRGFVSGLATVVLATSVAMGPSGRSLAAISDGVAPAEPRATGEIADLIAGDTAAFAAPVRLAAITDDRPALGGAITHLKSGLDALSAGDVAGARASARKLSEGSLDRRLIEWSIALRGGDEVASREIAAIAGKLDGWPSLSAMRANGEKALLRDKLDARIVIGAFGGTTPTTAEGAIALARAMVATGNRKAASGMLSAFWRTKKLEGEDEVAIIREFGKLIPSGAHRYRMEKMLYEDRVRSAQRVARLAGAEELCDAWSAVIRRDGNAGKLLNKVPQVQQSAGYLFALARHLRRQQRFVDAAKVMAKAPSDHSRLIDADEWWVERRVLSRELVDIGETRLAYSVAAGHSATDAAKIADAEFHAGWYALRALRDAGTAALHFARIADVSTGPISQARAYYWLGRAAEAGGPGDAKALFGKAAKHGMSFYGQLAAARLGRRSLNLAYPKPKAADRAAFARREGVHAIHRLEAAGYGWRADAFYRALAGELDSPGELALLAVMAERRDDHRLALQVGKIAAARGIDVGALAHPLGAIPSSARMPGAGRALAYAIARQESEFDTAAVSRAGARGLLQLMPNTARSVARKAGIAFSKQKLTTDAGYNATLGSAYLDEQLGRFDGSLVLTFAAYNAGPRRVEEWIERYGDPRRMSTDEIVDWIERIPYAETRNYVQRVMENFQVYSMRISGRFDIVGDLKRGR